MTGARLCGNVLKREAKRILRKLAGGAVLRQSAGSDFTLMQKPSVSGAARSVVAAEVVTALHACGFLVREGDMFVASAAGLSWYGAETGSACDGFAAQHRQMKGETLNVGSGKKQQVMINLLQSPLALLHARGLINPVQFGAGKRLERDYTKAQMTAHLCANWSAPRSTGTRRSAPVTADAVLDAKDRVRRAIAAVGPELSGVLFDLCCAGGGLSDVERRYGWPRASAKIVLRLALDRLARHYGMGVSVSHAAVRAWTVEEECK